MQKLIGPFRQIITLRELPLKGPLSDENLEIIKEGAVLIDGDKIVEVGPYKQFQPDNFVHERVEGPQVLLPSMVDCHTHLVWAGTRSADYAMRIAGKSYQEILQRGGGIFDSVSKTQKAGEKELLCGLRSRVNRHLSEGVTTIEVKSGYGLLKDDELKILEVIRSCRDEVNADLVPTCLAAHVCPDAFEKRSFLEYLQEELLPLVLKRKLAQRVDIFVEEGAFSCDLARDYLFAAKRLGFDLAVHADQFTAGGAALAVEVGARSADHLEASTDEDITKLAKSQTMSVALPGASIGLGMNYAPARKLLDHGAGVAIATDWNPGSAPMGDLLIQAALIGVYEKLTTAELLASVTFRAASALGLNDRGVIAKGLRADLMAFSVPNVEEVFYNQGKIKPVSVWKNGLKVIEEKRNVSISYT